MYYLKLYKFEIIASIIGAVLGYIYYAKVGCVTGSCAITSSPINSTLYGAVLGYLLIGIIKPNKNKNHE